MNEVVTVTHEMNEEDEEDLDLPSVQSNAAAVSFDVRDIVRVYQSFILI